MGEKNYLRYFTATDRLRVSFTTTQGDVQRFVVQYEALVEEAWTPMVRYDTAHGFFHMDLIGPHRESEKVVLEFTNYNEALTFAIAQIRTRWEGFRRQYEEVM